MYLGLKNIYQRMLRTSILNTPIVPSPVDIMHATLDI